MVGIKLAVVLFVIVVGAFYVEPGQLASLRPLRLDRHQLLRQHRARADRRRTASRWACWRAAIIFFAYIGFDSVSTHAEEARNPQRDVPIGIIASLIICTVLYIAVSAVLTGMVPLRPDRHRRAGRRRLRAARAAWAQFLISVGAVAGITSVLLVMMLSQPRVLLAMARDGLVPPQLLRRRAPALPHPLEVHDPDRRLRGRAWPALLPLRILAELVNIGTLLAFVIVCAAVLIMRRTHPEAERPFRAPFVPVVPILGILVCLLLMFSLPAENWLRLFVWLLLGFVIYFALRPPAQRHGEAHGRAGVGAGQREAALLTGESSARSSERP